MAEKSTITAILLNDLKIKGDKLQAIAVKLIDSGEVVIFENEKESNSEVDWKLYCKYRFYNSLKKTEKIYTYQFYRELKELDSQQTEELDLRDLDQVSVNYRLQGWKFLK